MDYGIVGSIFTVVVLVCFIGIVLWAFSKKSKAGFDEAANLIFDDEKQQSTTQQSTTKSKQESSINE